MFLRSVFGLISLLACANASAVIAFADVYPGEALEITFRFDNLPPHLTGNLIDGDEFVGYPEIFRTNGGSVSNGVGGAGGTLYADGVLIGTYHSTQRNAFTSFTQIGTHFFPLWDNPTNLDPLFYGGATGVVRIEPLFNCMIDCPLGYSPSNPPFISYQLDFVEAGYGARDLVNGQTFAATILGIRVVPEPSSLVLLASGLLLAGLGSLYRSKRSGSIA